jgi:hypothetical protein
MADFLAFGLTIAMVGLIMGGFVWLASQVRRRGIGGGVMGPIQDMWDPITYHTNTEMHVQAERKTPAPSPGDPPTL